MKIAVASGKGGTGKTTISIALAEALGNKALLLDCDVEEPNCHLFLSGDIAKREEVSVMVPEFHSENCTGCGKCAKACRFNAIASLGKKMLIFEELCHSCGGCLRACPTKSLSETQMVIGEIDWRNNQSFDFATGILNVGHALSVPLIKELKTKISDDKICILDSPPGTACPMVNTVRDCDFVILVTEPTPFGLHDLSVAVETLKSMKIPHAVVVNRDEENTNIPDEYCTKNGINILMRIPFSREIAEGYSNGKTLLQTVPEMREDFLNLLKGVGAL